jgi:hypothetical protein
MSDQRDAAQRTRLQLLAIDFTLPSGPRVADAIRLAEELVASGFDGPATLQIAALPRDCVLSDADPQLRAMLLEHQIEVPRVDDEDAQYRVLITAFGFWDLPLHGFEGSFYARLPTWDDQEPLDRTLLLLFDRLDHETELRGRMEIETEMRAAVRAALAQ